MYHLSLYDHMNEGRDLNSYESTALHREGEPTICTSCDSFVSTALRTLHYS